MTLRDDMAPPGAELPISELPIGALVRRVFFDDGVFMVIAGPVSDGFMRGGPRVMVVHPTLGLVSMSVASLRPVGPSET